MMQPCEFRNRDDLTITRHDQIANTENSLTAVYIYFFSNMHESCVYTEDIEGLTAAFSV
jgi:hypothetical protein